MTSMISGTDLRAIGLGTLVQGKTSALSGAAVEQVFTVAGGQVLITALWGVCTVEMAGANTLNLQIDPTAGDTSVIVTATDLGTTNTTVGTVIGTANQGDGTIDFAKNGFALSNLVVPAGEVEVDCVGAGADGSVAWYATYIPLTTGATMVASA